MAPPITSTSTLPMHEGQEVELGRDLGAADERHHRALRRLERRGERLELRLHQPPGGGGQQMRQRLGRGMRAMRRGEGVVDVEIAERRELPREAGIVASPRRMEAEILQQRHVAGARARDDHALRRGPTQSSAKATGRPPSASASGAASGFSESAGSGLPLGRPKCDITTTSGAALGAARDGRREPLDAGRVGDRAVLHRHVEIGAQQHAFAAGLEIVDRLEGRHIGRES